MAAKPSPAEFPITLRPVADLTPYERNARTHSAEQIEQLKGLIRLVGFTNPILADADGIIAGHGRRQAVAEMLAAGETIYGPGKRHPLPPGMVPVVDASGMSEAERRAYIIADNQVALNSGWDLKLAAGELTALEGLNFDLSALGFSAGELSSFFLERDYGLTDPNAEWKGMPEFKQEDKSAFRTIPVHFADQAAVDKFAALLGQKITDRTRFLWFPEIVIETYADKQYAADA